MKSKQNSLKIGDKIRDIRTQLWMSINTLSIRSKIDKDFLTQIESGEKQPDFAQLCRIADALFFSLNVELKPNGNIQDILKAQARKKAANTIRYVQGTMSLEAQEPSKDYIEQLIEKETESLLSQENQSIWDME